MKRLAVLNLTLQFDADQLTRGDARMQAEQALDLINLALQRDSFGLGAQLSAEPGRLRFIEADALDADDGEAPWQRNLRPGDEVTWVDPDDGICSRTGRIAAIEFPAEGVARITWDDGTETEAPFSELN